MSIKRLSGAGLTTPKSNKIWDQTTYQSGMFALATVAVPSGGSSTVSFSGIPNTYTHLELHCIARSNISGSGNNIGLYLRFNSDSTSGNYYWHELAGNGSSPAAYGQSDTGINVNPHSPRAGDAANTFGANIITILDYANTSKNTTVKAVSGNDTNGGGWIHVVDGVWNQTSAVHTLTFFMESSSIDVFSHFALYGIKAA